MASTTDKLPSSPKASQHIQIKPKSALQAASYAASKLANHLTGIDQQTIFDAALDGIIIASPEGFFLAVNPAYGKMMGHPPEELIGMHVSALVHPAHTSKLHLFAEKMLSDGHVFYESVDATKAGRAIPVEVHAVPYRYRSKPAIMAIVRDTSKRKSIEAALAKSKRETERLQREHTLAMDEAKQQNMIGEISSGIAHELNQPLAVISAYAGVALQRLKKGKFEKDMLLSVLEKVEMQATRAGQVLHRIRELFHTGGLVCQMNNVNAVIENAIALQQHNFPADLELTCDLADDLPTIYIDNIQIEQVIMNIIRNAYEAFPKSNIESPAISIRSYIEQTERYVIIAIQDNGIGLPEDIVNQVFSPFFSTKPQGMGMGLTICQTIVEAHSGRLEVSSKPGQTEFQIMLPIK
ncbi:MAG: hypothetical protein DHS20C10_06320 [marine bacterium B5-7]|nr:MAG: hypothetical protein DHS20C10_06320 [marine bacterium B5-7]